MEEIAQTQPSTIVERGERAQVLERQVVAGCRAIRGAWMQLAALLHEMNAGQHYQLLGYDTFKSWLGSPEVSLSPSHAYALIGIHAEFVIEGGLGAEDIGSIEATKLAETLPALRSGVIDMQTAIDDAAALSKSDLREKYRDGDLSGRLDAERERPICPHCKRRMPAGKVAA